MKWTGGDKPKPKQEAEQLITGWLNELFSQPRSQGLSWGRGERDPGNEVALFFY